MARKSAIISMFLEKLLCSSSLQYSFYDGIRLNSTTQECFYHYSAAKILIFRKVRNFGIENFPTFAAQIENPIYVCK